MNTYSKKCQLPIHHPNHQLDDKMVLLNTCHHFFTLPNMLDNHTYIHMVQWDTCPYDIQDLEPEEIAEWMRFKKKQARRMRMLRIQQEAEIQAEKVRQLKRELWLIHKRSQTESGVFGIVWWAQGYWNMGSKKLGIMKEEPSTPPLPVKVKPPPTPPLTYPPSCTTTSQFRSIDPNDFVWSPIYEPSPF